MNEQTRWRLGRIVGVLAVCLPVALAAGWWVFAWGSRFAMRDGDLVGGIVVASAGLAATLALAFLLVRFLTRRDRIG